MTFFVLSADRIESRAPASHVGGGTRPLPQWRSAPPSRLHNNHAFFGSNFMFTLVVGFIAHKEPEVFHSTLPQMYIYKINYVQKSKKHSVFFF